MLERDELVEPAAPSDEEVRRDAALGVEEKRHALFVGLLRRVVDDERGDRLDLPRVVAFPPGVGYGDEAGAGRVASGTPIELPEPAILLAADARQVLTLAVSG